MIADSVAGQARVPHAVRRLLLDALALRDAHPGELARRDADVIEGHAVAIDPLDGRPTCAAPAPAQPALPAPSPEPVAAADTNAADTDAVGRPPQSLQAGRAELQARLDRLLAGRPTHAPNRKLLGHLSNEREHLLTFLDTPGVEATNWRAEQAIRPAVVNRKHRGGNRTWRGADTQQALMSVIRTARQQNIDAVTLLTELQRQPRPAVAATLTIPAAARQPLAGADSPPPARGP